MANETHNPALHRRHSLSVLLFFGSQSRLPDVFVGTIVSR
jgi:hypothetical protein